MLFRHKQHTSSCIGVNDCLFIVICRYSTGSSLSPSDTLIHDFYGREVANPVLLTVDTAFAEEKVNIKVFVSTLLTLGERQLAAQFHEVQLDLRLIEAERIGCKHICYVYFPLQLLKFICYVRMPQVLMFWVPCEFSLIFDFFKMAVLNFEILSVFHFSSQLMS